MGMQGMGTAPARNQQVNPKVSVPEKSGSPGTVPSSGNGQSPGSAVKGFSGNGTLPGKIKA